jgi:hypothetical protein
MNGKIDHYKIENMNANDIQSDFLRKDSKAVKWKNCLIKDEALRNDSSVSVTHEFRGVGLMDAVVRLSVMITPRVPAQVRPFSGEGGPSAAHSEECVRFNDHFGLSGYFS